MSASLGADAPAAESANVEPAAPSPLKRVSLFHYSPALIFLVIVVADITRLADPDLWGHVRFGQDVLAQRHLIFYDRYSYSAPGHLWLNHEWLSEVLMAAIYNAFGTVGLKLMKFACSAATILFLALALEETESPARVQFAILIAASAPLATHLQFRPRIFTFALMSSILAILSRYNYRGRAPVWLAIPILALWANLHGGFIMGLAALGTFTAVVFAQDLAARRGMRRAMWLLAITAASTIATLARHTALALRARRERLGLPVAHAKDRSPTINQLAVAVAAFELLILTGLFSKKMAAGDPYPVGAISYMGNIA
jgi:hypothetical protein